MEKYKSEIILSNPPHIKADQSIESIMLMVIIALLPSTVYSVYIYGLKVLYLILASTIASVIAEALYQFLMKKKISVSDGSAAITGLLLAMNVPPDAPIWMIVIGAFIAIIIVKQLFGGLGFNIFNPALAARAFLLASWPIHMTTRWHHFSNSNVLSNNIENVSNLPVAAFDAVTSATPLGTLREVPKILSNMNISPDALYQMILSKKMFISLFIGNIGGCIGETSALFILIGGIFLLYKRIISWHIPVSFISTVAVSMLLYYTAKDIPGSDQIPYFNLKITLYHILSGGLFLGAFFMATDMVTTPVTYRGMLVFGMGCGIITSIIRLWGGYPEGVSYSILLMNAAVPLIDKFTKPVVFGLTDD